MLGWWIRIRQKTPAECDATKADDDGLLASWDTNAWGCGWLRKLVEEGKAQQLIHHGYPNRYVANAGDVLPLIKDGLPEHNGPTVIGEDYVTPGDWVGKVTFDVEKIAACPGDQVLTIDAWDQS